MKRSLALAAMLSLAGPAWPNTFSGQLTGSFGNSDFYYGPGRVVSRSLAASWRGVAGLDVLSNDTLVPGIQGNYSNTDQVLQFAGGGTLVNHTLNNEAYLRWLHPAGDWKIKPSVTYRNQLVNQPAAVPGSNFDSNHYAASLEFERLGGAFKSIRQVLSAARVQYYHYRGQESTLGLAPELTQDDEALDFYSYDYNASLHYELWKDSLLGVSAQASYRDFFAQHLAQTPTSLSNGRRHDFLGGATVNLSRKWEGRWTTALSGSYFILDSNQNDIDAVHRVLNPNFYSYQEAGAQAQVRGKIWGPLTGTANYSATRRAYDHRPTQSANSNYTGGTVVTWVQSANGRLDYHLGGGLSLTATVGYTMSMANTYYEGLFLYRYHLINYSGGVSYAF